MHLLEISLCNNGCIIHQWNRKIKTHCLLWICDDYNSDATPPPVTHKWLRNKMGVDREKVLGWEEKGAMCITRTDRSGGGVSQGISREEKKIREKGFNYPRSLRQSKHMGYTPKTVWIRVWLDKYTQAQSHEDTSTKSHINICLLKQHFDSDCIFLESLRH